MHVIILLEQPKKYDIIYIYIGLCLCSIYEYMSHSDPDADADRCLRNPTVFRMK